MTDRPHDRLTPEQDAAVRRLLTEARHTGPMPADVATRLEETLAGLAAERDPAPVVDLAARRRRRWATGLVAAAAVMAAGVGMTRLVPGGAGDESASESVVAGDAGAASAEAGDGGGGAGSEAARSRPGAQRERALASPVRIRARHFARDVRVARATALTDQLVAGPGGEAEDQAAPCGPTAPPPGVVRVPARYAGSAAVLLFSRPDGGRQGVVLYVCGEDRPRRRLTLYAP